MLCFSCVQAECSWKHASEIIPEESFGRPMLFVDMKGFLWVGEAVNYPYHDEFISHPMQDNFILFVKSDGSDWGLAQWWMDLPDSPWKPGTKVK